MANLEQRLKSFSKSVHCENHTIACVIIKKGKEMSSTIGNKITIEVWGASHAPEIGVTICGLPEGKKFDLKKAQAFLDRRKGGQNAYSTKRAEADMPDIQRGLMKAEDGNDSLYLTTGEDMTAIFYNQNTRSSDYDNMKYIPRPSHADYTSYVKYGDRLTRSGGGIFSGRLTLPLCFAGAVCLQMMEDRGIEVFGHVSSIGEIKDRMFDPLGPEREEIGKGEDHFPVLDKEAGEKMVALMTSCAEEGDSIGGTIECAVTGLPAGVGEPLYDSVESTISQLIFNIPAVKGIEFGSGFECSEMKGSECNDPFGIEDGKIVTRTNHSGGIQGGISNGMPILFKVAIKPTPSIYKEQQTVDMKEMKEVTLSLKGRHDPCIVPRALPCVEAACAIAIYNLLIESENSRLPRVEKKTLNSLRDDIDELDDKISRLMAKRMSVASEIAAEKKKDGLTVKNEEREKEVLTHVGERAGKEKAKYVQNVYKKMIEETCLYETELMKGGND